MGNESNNGKVPLISKIAYGFGDVGCNFSWMFVSNFLMIFYTDVFGISMAAVSALTSVIFRYNSIHSNQKASMPQLWDTIWKPFQDFQQK